ncbi:MAG: ankyrin repeat domain-containing protein [Defluviicoccus sp.]|nr:ankyrin repeat domain-containing protein [Defluviicoccus sp.]
MGQSQRGVAAETAKGWAEELVGSLLRRSAARGDKLALQPLHPADFAGLNRRQREQLHGQLLRALSEQAVGRYELVDRSSLAHVARALEESVDPRWQESYLQVLRKAHAWINIVCGSTPGAVSIDVECKATDIRDGRALASSSASFALGWLNRPIALDLAVGLIARDIAQRVGDTARLEDVRIVDGRTGGETGLSKHVAGSLEHSIGRHMGATGGGGAGFRLEGTIGKSGAQDGRLLLRVRLSFGDGRSLLFQEYVARASAPFLDAVGPQDPEDPPACKPDAEIAKRVLPAGYTLGDWRLLATDRLKRRDYVRLVVEAKAHLRDHCDWSGAREVFDLALSGLAAGIGLSGQGDARRALARIAEIEGSVGEHPVLLGLRARAHRLLGAYAQEEEAHRRWLRLAPESHPERRATLRALMRAQLIVSDGARFSESLGRAFSAAAKEESAGWTDLHHAAVLNLPGVVQALVDAGVAADVRLRDDLSRFSDTLQGFLIGLGHEDFKVWEAYGHTPLMIAAFVNAEEAAATLVEAGADIRAKDRWGLTTLHYAAWANAHETAKWLVGRGADINAKDNFGATPLHHAAHGNALETAEWLVGRGADINARDNLGATPLHEAARGNARETAEWLVGRGADINAKANGGRTPLIGAVYRNALETVEWLVGRGVDINAKSKDRWTLLHHAAHGNALETAEWLAGRGADINAKDEYGRTPLHSAAFVNAHETAKWLVGRGADIHAKNNSGETPLHAAALGNARETAEWLVAQGADIGAKDKYGNTPLHHAARRNARETAEWLVGRGANVNAKDKYGNTPLDMTIASSTGTAQDRAATAALLRRLGGRPGASLQ